ncbi:hypothetical protein [Nocardia crassostreae]|uniref:hypothetical protein n=1 Tax=Nocardia crassostreae TaxID=53428 RepID=UPI00082CDFA9|nr:hypothetical protein [Nocardia crassostreae]
MNEHAIHRVEIAADSVGALRAFVDAVGPDLGCHPVVRQRAGRFVIEAYLSTTQLDAAAAVPDAAVSLDILENVTETGRQRQESVGAGNRYANRAAIPEGLGRKE